MITYPRKCEHCDYIANNPAMYSYHKKTHDPIPEDQLCSHGCGHPAKFRGTGGKFTCKEKYTECSGYLTGLSKRTKTSWANAAERKESTKQSLITRLHNEETCEKASRTKRMKFGTLDPAQAKEYRRYARFVRQRAQQWARRQGYVIGKQTYHVDHKFSVLDAWKAGLAESVVNHPANLQIIEARANSSKGSKSSISLEELLFLATASN